MKKAESQPIVDYLNDFASRVRQLSSKMRAATALMRKRRKDWEAGNPSNDELFNDRTVN